MQYLKRKKKKQKCPNAILTVKFGGDNIHFSIKFHFTINFISDVFPNIPKEK